MSEVITYVLPRIATQATKQISKNGLNATIKTSGDAKEAVKSLIKGLFN